MWRAAHTSQLQQKRKAICAHFKRGISMGTKPSATPLLSCSQASHAIQTRAGLTPREYPVWTRHLETMLAPWYPVFPDIQDIVQRRERDQIVWSVLTATAAYIFHCRLSQRAHSFSWTMWQALFQFHNKHISQIWATCPFLPPLIACALRAKGWQGSPPLVFKWPRDGAPGLGSGQGVWAQLPLECVPSDPL